MKPLYREKFLNVLSEDLDPVVNLPEEDEEQAVADTLDDTETSNQIQIPDNPEIALRKQQSERTIQTLSTWIGEVENFIDYLNGTEEGSINYTLNSSDCDSLLTDVQRSESKKISRLAQDLSSLGEALKQYLLLARRKESGADSI
jgi:hypothetical protein